MRCSFYFKLSFHLKIITVPVASLLGISVGFTDSIWNHQMPMVNYMIYDGKHKVSSSSASCTSHSQKKLSCQEACKSLFVSFSFPLEGKSMDPVVLLILPPHVRAAERGSDHIWTLLPSLDAHFRSQNKGVCGVHVCVREG